jgi:predicted metal-binding protein
MPCRASALFAQTSGQPSMAMIGRPERASFSKAGTSPPTPAMQDISALPRRSSCNATWLASCAALEQPEHEYTSGRDFLSLPISSSLPVSVGGLKSEVQHRFANI